MLKASLVTFVIGVLVSVSADIQANAACRSVHLPHNLQVDCFADADETSLLQTASSVKKRDRQMQLAAVASASSAAASVSVQPGTNVFQQLASAMKERFRTWQFNLFPGSLTAINSTAGVHGIPVMDTIFNMDRALGMLHPPRSDQQVLVVCICVIVLVASGWAIFWLLTRLSLGRDFGQLKLLLLCTSFGVASFGMNVVNKSLVESLRAPTLVTGAQMLMTAITSIILARGRFRGSLSEVLRWSPVPILFFGLLLSSFLTYKYLTLSMLMVVRNLGPLIVLPIEAWVMPDDKRPRVTWQMLLGLLVLLGSAFVYSYKIHVSVRGLEFAALNLVLAVADRMAQRRLLTTECRGLSTESCMLLNNVLGLIPTLTMAKYIGEFSMINLHLWLASSTAALLLLSGIIGSGICYFALAVQREIAATSFIVLQNVVRMTVVAVGVLVFHDPIGWPFQVVGLALSFLGALWYGKSLIDGKMQSSATKEVDTRQSDSAKRHSDSAKSHNGLASVLRWAKSRPKCPGPMQGTDDAPRA